VGDRLANGYYALHVHIADVSHYVRPGGAIDRKRACAEQASIFRIAAVPMLPHELSTEICSLKPNVDRLALSALLEIDNQGAIVAQEFTPAVIRSVERMTYTNVHLLLEGDAALRERYGPAGRALRADAGAGDDAQPQAGAPRLDRFRPAGAAHRIDEWGEMIGVQARSAHIAQPHHRKSSMLGRQRSGVVAPGEYAGRFDLPHSRAPRPEAGHGVRRSRRALRLFAGGGAIPVKKFGITDRHRDGTKRRREIVLATSVDISSRNYQKLAAKIEGQARGAHLSYLMLRSLKQARYSTDNVGHFALAAETYTHFTSPIRRYPDLMVHRLLRDALAGTAKAPAAAELKAIAEECSQAERRAADAERELVEWKKVRS